MASAWRCVWSMLHATEWVDHDDLRTTVEAHDLTAKTAANLLATARRNQLIERRGGYSRKTDTRQYRRHPKAAVAA
jgi:hypothetical protein